MLFHSQMFMLGFLPPVLLLFHGARTQRSREWVLVLASLVFYGGWDWRFVPALVALTLANWLCVRAWAGSGWRGWLGAGVALNLGVLGVCKYADFVAAQFGAGPLGIILPLGVSFFTFQKISYLVDLHRGDRHVYGLLEFFTFVTFFPQLIAGPIVRHSELIPQFARLTAASWQGVGRGLLLFGAGLAKKLLLADPAGQVADPLFALAQQGPVGLGQGWLAAGAYGLQILFDFSAYTDMAIGLGMMFGLRLPDNFNKPYRATSLREFWRRWHMTLSRWLRDYVYIPLGGNRGGHQARNVVLTMALGGLWHGAAWTFVAWGLAHGVVLAVNGAWVRTGWRMPAVLGWALTMAFVLSAWVLFRAPDFATAGTVLRGMAGLAGAGPTRVAHVPELAAAIALALLGPTSQALADRLRPRPWLAWPIGAALAGLLLLAGGRAPNEFIYFQF